MNGISKYWWLIWAFVAAGALVAMRMRSRGGAESIPTRIFYALFPHADPEKSPQRQLSGLGAVPIGGGVLLVALGYLLFLQSH